jgi:hypothetical protein
MTSYRNGFLKQTAQTQLHFLRIQFLGRPIETLFTQLYPSKGQVSVPGRMCQTSGGCSLWIYGYMDITQNTYVQS